jgi:Flp pilus assembly protein TadD
MAEFQKELQVNPDDFLSHAQLGYVALSQHRLQDAERDLTRAAELNPNDADVFMSLGQLYVETGRSEEAESALRKSIALTSDLSHNNYQVQRAHYLLARLLLQTNRVDEGKKEMQLSQELLKLSAPHNQNQAHTMSGNDMGDNVQLRSDKYLAQLATQALNHAEAAENELRPSIADSYNNIGVISAIDKDYAAACDFFEKAYKWNPTLDGLDYNWGRAAYSGRLYDRAAAPLDRYIQLHSDDAAMRSALGISLFLTRDYGRAAKVLAPIAYRVDAAPALAFMYAQSLVDSGEYENGIAQLRELSARDTQNASYHRVLGKALTHSKSYTEAAQELKSALRIDPSDVQTKYDLALTLVQIGKADEAQTQLEELAQLGSMNPDVYYRLGKLQLEKADTKSAILSFQKAVGLSPESEMVHLELASAYRRDARLADADREMKLAETIRDSRGSTHQ